MAALELVFGTNTLTLTLTNSGVDKIIYKPLDDYRIDTQRKIIDVFYDGKTQEIAYSDVNQTAYPAFNDLVVAFIAWAVAAEIGVSEITYYPLPAAAIQVTAPAVAATLQSLLEALDGSLTVAALAAINYIELNAEDDIRYNIITDPTATEGMKLLADQTRILYGPDTTEVILIGTGSEKVNVIIGTK